MSQFAVHRNKNPRTKVEIPFLLDVQSELLDDLATRVVIPLTKARALSKTPMSVLMPLVDLDGTSYLLLTPQLAGISKSDLGLEVANIANQKIVIVGALDMLITGV